MNSARRRARFRTEIASASSALRTCLAWAKHLRLCSTQQLVLSNTPIIKLIPWPLEGKESKTPNMEEPAAETRKAAWWSSTLRLLEWSKDRCWEQMMTYLRTNSWWGLSTRALSENNEERFWWQIEAGSRPAEFCFEFSFFACNLILSKECFEPTGPSNLSFLKERLQVLRYSANALPSLFMRSEWRLVSNEKVEYYWCLLKDSLLKHLCQHYRLCNTALIEHTHAYSASLLGSSFF